MSLHDLSVESARRAIEHDNGRLRAILRVIDPPLRDPSVSSNAALYGVPYTLKDTWDVAGIVTTGGSWRHRERVPSRSSKVHRALQKQGAVLLGKTNLSDLAFAPEAESYVGGRTANPFDVTRTAGGSSGGAAAAIASGMSAFDWGGDFAGSVRMPAGFCGITGIRFSSEVWPLTGEHFPESPTKFSKWLGWGPMAKTVDDCRAVADAVRGDLRVDVAAPDLGSNVVLYGPDAATRGEWPTFLADAARLFDRIGVRHGLATMLPPPKEASVVFNGWLCANFNEFRDGGEMSVREGWAAVTLGIASNGRLDRRMHPHSGLNFLLCEIGHRTVFRDAAKAEEKRKKLVEAGEYTWKHEGLIVAPMCTWPAPRHGRAAKMQQLQAFCKLGNVLDATAIAVPFGSFEDGLPRSIQVMGPPGSDDAVFDLARKIEAALS